MAPAFGADGSLLVAMPSSTPATDAAIVYAVGPPHMRVTTPAIDGKAGATFNNIDTRGPIGLVATTGAAYLAWSDSRATQANGDAEDAYFSRIRHTGPLRSGTSDTRTGWLWGLLGAGITLAAGGLVLLIGSRRAAQQ